MLLRFSSNVRTNFPNILQLFTTTKQNRYISIVVVAMLFTAVSVSSFQTSLLLPLWSSRCGSDFIDWYVVHRLHFQNFFEILLNYWVIYFKFVILLYMNEAFKWQWPLLDEHFLGCGVWKMLCSLFWVLIT